MGNWSVRQLEYARDILKAGQAHHAYDYDIQVALMVALTESGLQNLANSNVPESMSIPHDGVGNNHASVGIFQQQVGQWGSAQELMDPTTAANKFFDALEKIPTQSRIVMPPWKIAQQVQHSAYSDGSNYHAKYTEAQDLFKALGYTPNNTQGGVQNPGSAFNWIVQPHNWQRIGMGAIGAVLLILAVWFILKDTDTYKAVASTTKKAVETAAIA